MSGIPEDVRAFLWDVAFDMHSQHCRTCAVRNMRSVIERAGELLVAHGEVVELSSTPAMESAVPSPPRLTADSIGAVGAPQSAAASGSDPPAAA